VEPLFAEIGSYLDRCSLVHAESLLEFASSVLVVSPIVAPPCWNLLFTIFRLTNAEATLLEVSCCYIRNLVLKDKETAAGPQPAQQLWDFAIAQFRDTASVPSPPLSSVLHLMAALIQADTISDLADDTTLIFPVITECFAVPYCHLSVTDLVLVIAIRAFPLIQQFFGAMTGEFLNQWTKIANSTQLMVFFTQFSAEISAPERMIRRIAKRSEQEQSLRDLAPDETRLGVIPRLEIPIFDEPAILQKIQELILP
jgi:hypothetical protein